MLVKNLTLLALLCSFNLFSFQGGVKSVVKKTGKEIGKGGKHIGKEVGKAGKEVGKEVKHTVKAVDKSIKKK